VPILAAVTITLWALPAMADEATPAAEGAAQVSPFAGPGPQQIITSLTTLIIFLLLVVLLGKYAWGPIIAGLKSREDKIRKDIADAETTRGQAEATLRQYTEKLKAAEEQVRQLLSQAATDAEKLSQSIRMRAQADGEEIKERATRDIESAKNQALREVYEKTADLATEVASKILRRSLNADDQRDLVKRSLEQIETAQSN
jgi:F-type H+-transporting ATPase subunit b